MLRMNDFAADRLSQRVQTGAEAEGWPETTRAAGLDLGAVICLSEWQAPIVLDICVVWLEFL